MYRAGPLIEWLDDLRDQLRTLDLLDARVHFGLADPGGFIVTEEARESLELVDSRALVFPLEDPDG